MIFFIFGDICHMIFYKIVIDMKCSIEIKSSAVKHMEQYGG